MAEEAARHAGARLNPAAMVTFIQNHDQIANSAYGKRCDKLTSPGKLRAITALMLLAPGTPMLFQGQEFGASSPFLFFADHGAELAKQIRRGRAEFLAQFPSLATPEMQQRFADPGDPDTFERCKLDHSERETHREIYDLHRDLLKLRREEPVFRAHRQRQGVDGAVLSPEAFLLRFFGDQNDAGDDRLLLVNLGIDLHLDPAPEPLLAPPADSEWIILWSSEDPKYGGIGTPPLDIANENWRIPGHAAVLLRPQSKHMTDLVIRMPWPGKDSHAPEAGLNGEWLVTNGLGGYASGTLSGIITRRYHGYLVAALPAPFGRVMMLNELGERLELPDGRFVQLTGEERAGGP